MKPQFEPGGFVSIERLHAELENLDVGVLERGGISISRVLPGDYYRSSGSVVVDELMRYLMSNEDKE